MKWQGLGQFAKSFTSSDPSTQAEVQALWDKAEELAGRRRAHALRGALAAEELIKGAA